MAGRRDSTVPPGGATFRALYDFAGDGDDELGFQAGDLVIGLEQHGDWWQGTLVKDRDKIGLFPGNYVERVDATPVPVPEVHKQLQRVESWKPKRRESLSKAVPAKAAAGGPGSGSGGGGGGGGGQSGRAAAAAKARAGSSAGRGGGAGAELSDIHLAEAGKAHGPAGGAGGAAAGGAAAGGADAAAGEGGGEDVKKPKPKLPLVWGVLGHNMAKVASMFYFILGMGCLSWATSSKAETKEITDTNANVLVGLICMFAGPLMYAVEWKWGKLVPLFPEYRIPVRGIAWGLLALPALTTLPTLMAGFVGGVTAGVNTFAVLRGEVGKPRKAASKAKTAADDMETPQTLSQKAAAFWRRQQEADMVGQGTVIVLYVVGMLWYSIDTLVFYFDLIDSLVAQGIDPPSYWAPWAKVGGALLNLNCSLLLMPIVKGVLQVLNRQRCGSRATLATYLPLRKNVAFHKLIAKVIAASALLHVFCHFMNFAVAPAPTLALFPNPTPEGRPWYGSVPHAPWYTGALICIAMFFIYSAAPAEVKQAKYQIFWKSHHFFILFYANLLFHGPVFLYWSILPLTLYAAERWFRVKRGNQPVYVLSVKWIEPVLCISWRPKYKEQFPFVEGQYLYLNCPFIASDEWHPFTISSARGDLDRDGVVTNHIRVYDKGWTGALKRYFQLMNPHNTYPLYLSHRDESGAVAEGKLTGVDGRPLLRVDGPHAAPSMHYDAYKTVMIVGAGIGLTPAASIIKAVLRHKWKKGHLPEIIHFYWIVRQSELESFQWFVQVLAELEAEYQRDRSTGSVNPANYIEINVYVTRPEDGYKTPELKEAAEVDEKLRAFAPFTTAQLLDRMVHPVVSSKLQVKVQRDPGTAPNKMSEIYIWNGRPDWDGIFAEMAERRVHKDIGVCFCGAYVIGKDLKEMCVKHSNVANDVHFHLHKENF